MTEAGGENLVRKIMTKENFDRVTGFVMELRDAVELTVAGLAMLRDAPPESVQYVPALTLLGSGFERLLRSALAAAWTRDHGRLPDAAEFGRQGYCDHEILAMWKELARASDSASADLVAALSAGAVPGTAEYRLLELLTDQAGARGRYAQQRTYLGSRDQAVTPSVRLQTEAMIRLWQRGRLHAYLDGVEGTKDEFHAARQDAVVELGRLASVVAALFEQGLLGAFATEFSFLVTPLQQHSSPHRDA